MSVTWLRTGKKPTGLAGEQADLEEGGRARPVAAGGRASPVVAGLTGTALLPEHRLVSTRQGMLGRRAQRRSGLL